MRPATLYIPALTCRRAAVFIGKLTGTFRQPFDMLALANGAAAAKAMEAGRLGRDLTTALDQKRGQTVIPDW